MQRALIFIFIILILQACGLGGKERLITFEGRYSLSIPSFLVKTNKLNEDASIQYQHAIKELYMIVIEDSKGTVLRVK